MHERVRQAGFDRRLAPAQVMFLLPAGALDRRRELDETFGGVGPPVEDDVLDLLEQILRNVLVHNQLAGVDDAHVHAGLDRVIEERRVNRLAHVIVAAERERQVAHPAADLHARTGRLDDPRRLDEVDRVVVVFFEAGRDGQNVRVENDVGRRDVRLLGEQLIGALADRDLPLDGIRLALLVERHHDDAGAVAADEARFLQEVRFAFLHADGIDDRLPLHALEAGDQHRPLRAVDHHRDARDVRLGADVIQEVGHGALGIEHALVHVDVDQVGAAAHLIESDRCGFSVVAGTNQPRELRRAGDIGALADHLEVAVGANREDFEAGELRKAFACGLLMLAHRPWLQRGHRFGDRLDVVRRRAAAAADDIDESTLGKLAQRARGIDRLIVVFAEGVRQPGVRIAADVAVGNAGQVGDVLAHVAAPSAQLTPTLNGFACATDTQKASIVWPDSAAARSVMVTEIMTGSRRPSSSNTSSSATMPALTLSVSTIVSSSSRSTRRQSGRGPVP